MSDNNKEEMAASAQAFMELSKKMLEETMASCQMEPFKGVILNIPTQITANGVRPESVSQDQVWQHINRLYAAQENLFNPTELVQSPPPVQTEDEQMNDVNKMLGL